MGILGVLDSPDVEFGGQANTKETTLEGKAYYYLKGEGSAKRSRLVGVTPY